MCREMGHNVLRYYVGILSVSVSWGTCCIDGIFVIIDEKSKCYSMFNNYRKKD